MTWLMAERAPSSTGYFPAIIESKSSMQVRALKIETKNVRLTHINFFIELYSEAPSAILDVSGRIHRCHW
jgi:hypothetical protein